MASKDTVAEWDGFIFYTQGGSGFPVRLGYGELGADDVVYSNSASTTAYMHKIEHADSEDGFEVTQHFKVPAVYAWTVPNFPNYFLGPLEGSPCAQMFGPPTAQFAYEGQSHEVAFEDQSVGVPLVWHWDFGDGSASDEQHPEHVYMNQGTYTVCLTASNIYGGDMTCSDVMVKTSAVEPQSQQGLLEVYPNPVTDRLEIRFPDAEGQVYLYSVFGQLVATTQIHQGSATLSLEHCCSSGTYIVDVHLQNGIVLREILIIQ